MPRSYPSLSCFVITLFRRLSCRGLPRRFPYWGRPHRLICWEQPHRLYYRGRPLRVSWWGQPNVYFICASIQLKNRAHYKQSSPCGKAQQGHHAEMGQRRPMHMLFGLGNWRNAPCDSHGEGVSGHAPDGRRKNTAPIRTLIPATIREPGSVTDVPQTGKRV